MAHILGIDYGTKRIGLAWSPDGTDLILPFGVISVKNAAQVTDELLTCISEEHIGMLVCGLPLDLSGNETDWSQKIQENMSTIAQKADIPIAFIDERFSTAFAGNFAGSGASKDEIAAMSLVETYKSQQKNS